MNAQIKTHRIQSKHRKISIYLFMYLFIYIVGVVKHWDKPHREFGECQHFDTMTMTGHSPG